MSSNLILCAHCDTPCGKVVPPTFDDPGWWEGVGENFAAPDGRWCCSLECLRALALDDTILGFPAKE